ncbi:MAG: hypothetical protein WB685_06595, partial [Pseudolabrys sp.]
EWNLLKQQFDALADEESPDADSLEEIFDMEFRRRFGELINQTAHHRRRTGTSLPAHFIAVIFKDLKDEPISRSPPRNGGIMGVGFIAVFSGRRCVCAHKQANTNRVA